MTNYIWVTNQKEMIHKYPDAPEGVEFLKNEHRHLFKFKTWIEVFHDDRDVEFILFKRFMDKVINEMDKNLGVKSCEMISNYLYKKINETHPKRSVIIEVSEDGENGSHYQYISDIIKGDIDNDQDEVKDIDDGKNSRLDNFNM